MNSYVLLSGIGIVHGTSFCAVQRPLFSGPSSWVICSRSSSLIIVTVYSLSRGGSGLLCQPLSSQADVSVHRSLVHIDFKYAARSAWLLGLVANAAIAS